MLGNTASATSLAIVLSQKLSGFASVYFGYMIGMMILTILGLISKEDCCLTNYLLYSYNHSMQIAYP